MNIKDQGSVQKVINMIISVREVPFATTKKMVRLNPQIILFACIIITM